MKIVPAQVYRLVRRIPAGRVSSYGIIARALGRPGAGRAVGAILRRNPRPGAVPCHRVVCADGRLGGYFGGGQPAFSRKALLLAGEGVRCRVTRGRARVDPGPAGFFRDFDGAARVPACRAQVARRDGPR